MTEFNPIEGRENKIENKTLGPIFMVFRENKNWDKYAPKIVEHIKSLGGHIETKSFPRGTDEDEVNNWYKENNSIFESKFLLTDETCEPKVKIGKPKKHYSLDVFLENSNKKIIDDVLKKAFGENGPINLSVKEKYIKIVKLALENYIPKKVTLVENKFGHHAGFVDGDRSVSKDKDVLEFTKQCLIDAGYPESDIVVVDDIDNVPNLDEAKSMENEWFFIDSHNKMADTYRSKGLTVFGPEEIIKTTGTNEDTTVEKNLLFEVDSNFRKADSIESFISKYGSDPIIEDELDLGKMIESIGNGDKLIEIINYLVDLHKNDAKWKDDSIDFSKFDRMDTMLYIAETRFGFILDSQKKDQLEKKIKEIMASPQN